MKHQFKMFVAVTSGLRGDSFDDSRAYAVTASSANKILATLNKTRHMLKDGESWRLYNMDGREYGTSACHKCIIIRNGYLYDGFYN